MKQCTFTIIIPIYNGRQYLHRCINCVLLQSFADFELILVDDGSTDDSLAICRQFAEKDSRIRVIHQENGGVSVARNTGIDAAHGRWIMFLDVDDQFTPDCLGKVASVLEEGTTCMFSTKAECEEVFWLPVYKTSKTYKDVSEMTSDRANLNHLSGACWGYAYDADYLNRSGIKFPKGVTTSEDMVFNIRYFADYQNKIICLSDCLYIYNDANENSATRKGETLRKASSHINAALLVGETVMPGYLRNAWAKELIFFNMCAFMGSLAAIPFRETWANRKKLSKQFRRAYSYGRGYSVKFEVAKFNLPLYVLLCKMKSRF